MGSDTPAEATIYRNVHDALDNKPQEFECIITDEIGTRTLLVKLLSDGEMTINSIGRNTNVWLHLPADFTKALVYTVYDRLCEVEEWQYHQDTKPKQAANGPTQDHEPAGITHEMTEDAYQNGLLSEEEYQDIRAGAWVAASVSEE